MTASERLREMNEDDSGWETEQRLRELLPLIADVVEAAEELRRAQTDYSWNANQDWHKRHDIGSAENFLTVALTSLREHLETP